MNHISLHQTALEIRESQNPEDKKSIIWQFLNFHMNNTSNKALSAWDQRVIELLHTILEKKEISEMKEALLELKDLTNTFEDTLSQVDRLMNNQSFLNKNLAA